MDEQVRKVTLSGRIKEISEGFQIVGVWSFPGNERNDKFEWKAAKESCEFHADGTPKVLVCSGTFDANSFQGFEKEVVLELCKLSSNLNSVETSSPSTVTNRQIGDQRSAQLHTNETMMNRNSALDESQVYLVTGRGNNIIGDFHLGGSASKAPGSDFLSFKLTKKYTTVPRTIEQPEGRLRGENHGMIPRKRTRQARMRAQRCRKRQLRRSTNVNRTSPNICLETDSSPFLFPSPLLIPSIEESNLCADGKLQLSWRVSSASNFGASLTKMFPASAEMSLSVSRKCVAADELINFPDMVTEFKSFQVQSESSANFSHTLDGLGPGTYELCICVVTPKLYAPEACCSVEVHVPLNRPRNVTVLLYSNKAQKSVFAVASWNHPENTDPGNVAAYRVQCQVFRRARGEWVTVSEQTVTGNVTHCSIDKLPRRNSVRVKVAAVSVYSNEMGKHAVSSAVNPMNDSISSCMCVICGTEVLLDSHKKSSSSVDKQTPVGPGCCSHMFHSNCLAMWIQTQIKQHSPDVTCPLCLQEFSQLTFHSINLPVEEDYNQCSVEKFIVVNRKGTVP